MFQSRVIPDFPPSRLLQVAALYADQAGTCLLYSGSKGDSAQKSILSLLPSQVFTSHDSEDPWDLLQSSLTWDPSCTHPLYFGFLSYEMGAFSDPELQTSHEKGELPFYYFQESSVVLVVDHLSETCEVFYRIVPMRDAAGQGEFK